MANLNKMIQEDLYLSDEENKEMNQNIEPLTFVDPIYESTYNIIQDILAKYVTVASKLGHSAKLDKLQQIKHNVCFININNNFQDFDKKIIKIKNVVSFPLTPYETNVKLLQKKSIHKKEAEKEEEKSEEEAEKNIKIENKKRTRVKSKSTQKNLSQLGSKTIDEKKEVSVENILANDLAEKNEVYNEKNNLIERFMTFSYNTHKWKQMYVTLNMPTLHECKERMTNGLLWVDNKLLNYNTFEFGFFSAIIEAEEIYVKCDKQNDLDTFAAIVLMFLTIGYHMKCNELKIGHIIFHSDSKVKLLSDYLDIIKHFYDEKEMENHQGSWKTHYLKCAKNMEEKTMFETKMKNIYKAIRLPDIMKKLNINGITSKNNNNMYENIKRNLMTKLSDFEDTNVELFNNKLQCLQMLCGTEDNEEGEQYKHVPPINVSMPNLDTITIELEPKSFTFKFEGDKDKCERIICSEFVFQTINLDGLMNDFLKDLLGPILKSEKNLTIKTAMLCGIKDAKKISNLNKMLNALTTIIYKIKQDVLNNTHKVILTKSVKCDGKYNSVLITSLEKESNKRKSLSEEKIKNDLNEAKKNKNI